jgi:hypothetical protein
MNLKYLKLFEQYRDGKFSIQDIDTARKSNKGIKSDIVKELPNHNTEDYMKIVSIDTKNNEIAVSVNNGVYYIDLKNVLEIEK